MTLSFASSSGANKNPALAMALAHSLLFAACGHPVKVASRPSVVRTLSTTSPNHSLTRGAIESRDAVLLRDTMPSTLLEAREET
eukprot:CAMPEP_0179443620 /NCGR_PEP_ID=MMETSP0799-20121207/27069_1 /TAXON_ID=46947 /ORGANISM="Geminigera cryophila, Strain CCMP2564" /LENGTH=83 /DNA_ID=CAMNT_0021229851 /DNA_START=1723 /DNA_END=1974 /DNA_ORIENTATION=-